MRSIALHINLILCCGHTPCGGARGKECASGGEMTDGAGGILLYRGRLMLVREVMQEAIDRISGAEYERSLLTAPEWSHMTDENWVKHVRKQCETGRASASMVKRYEAMREKGLICQQLDE